MKKPKELFRRASAILPILVVFALLAGCNQKSNPTPVDEALIYTNAAQTVMAALTATAANMPSPTATATATQEPTTTATPTEIPLAVLATATPGSVLPHAGSTSCDQAGFVADVTIPDGTKMAAKQVFTKTWKLRNDGTCTWNADYEIVFYSGAQMGGPTTKALPDEVAPGETVEVSLVLTAPKEVGTYTGYWVLRNASAVNFGIGSAGSPFYVQIKVDTSSTGTITVTVTPTTTGTVKNTRTPTSTSTGKRTRTPTATITATMEPTSTDTETPTATLE